MKTAAVQDIRPMLTNLKWIHSIASGVERLLIPELHRGSVVVTNGRVNHRTLALINADLAQARQF